MPCHLDTDLLTLAVQLARRDVARIRDPSNLIALQQQQQQLLTELPESSHLVTTRTHAPFTEQPISTVQFAVLFTPTPLTLPIAFVFTLLLQRHVQVPGAVAMSQPITSNERKWRSVGSRKVDVAAHSNSPGPVDGLPVRSLSPPTRDIDQPKPVRAKALHEPTEKQLQSARDSHMRQLQAKIARYSAAMAELRLQTKAATAEKKSSPRDGGSVTQYSGLTRGRGRGRSLSGRVQQGSRSGSRSALIRHDVVPLSKRSRPTQSARRQRTKPSSPIHTDSEMSTDHTGTDSITKRMHEQVNTLWQQTVQALRHRNPDLIVLEPDSQMDAIPLNNPHVIPLEHVASVGSELAGGVHRTGAPGADRIPLRLPTDLHCALLRDAHKVQQLKADYWKKRGLLTSGGAANLHLVRVCESIADELLDRAISDVAEDLEREVSCFVDAVVDGELYSDAPDSFSLTNQTTDCQSSVTNFNSRPESSTRASGSLGSIDRLSTLSSSHRTLENAFSLSSHLHDESKQNRFAGTSPSATESHSTCAKEPSYTFQFDQVTGSAENLSRSSPTLLANLIIRSNEVDDSDASNDVECSDP
ncbi:unnamed protein product [Echinostoma caproni]|uniref:AAA domain-containing protein n=1 Tax=Echinostoma caproni TaxID=27848 RepID=A0A183AGB1_9TREM|nr:unnamed protein product [Echinostoma caproni]